VTYGKGEVPQKRFICKFCKVPVISKKNTRAIYTHEHKRNCPRRKK